MRPCQLLRIAVTLLFVLAVSTAAFPQQTNLAPTQTGKTPPLIIQPVDETNLTVLRGNTHPFARPEFDRGAAPPSLPTQRMLLVLKRSAQQESALEQLLDEQQDKSSPNYHAWLAPEQFGQQFGPADEDIQTITSWLQSHGFQVARVANGRTIIEFSGIAAQVKDAFHAEIHRYVVDGEEHWANANDPQIPTALTPVVAGTLTLHNFPRTPMYHLAGLFSREKATGKIQPVKSFITFPGGCDQDNNCYALGPSDFATIYNVLPLWNAPTPVDGTGQTIAIVGESNINIQDVRDFRTFFGLPANDPQIILDGPDPGLQPDETEADLDVQWSGAVAKGATIKLVLSASTFTTLGVDLSAQYIVDNNVAPILSESYGECELFIGTAGNQFYNQLWQQAAAQGITAFLSSGDQGSAVCDRQFEAAPQPAQFGLQVSGFSSTPYNISVGGTDFNDLLNPTQFWSTTNNSTTQASAKGYIPEVTWNDTCTNAIFSSVGFTGTPEQNCNNPQLAPFVVALGGSGGKSSCTSSDGQNPSTCSGGYAKPSWQTGLGVPKDGKRDVPDVSLFASNGFEGNFYIICEIDTNRSATSCDPNTPFSDFVGIGGTSASSPAFAGIMALVEQQTGSRQGNANYVFYNLAGQNSCPSASAPAASCVFYDVTGGTIAMPCAKGSPNCTTKTSGDAFGVLSGFNAGPGYDQATGLGSVNVANLVKNWNNVSASGKATTVNLTATTNPPQSPIAVTHGTPISVSVTVVPAQSGTGTPTGNVALMAATGPDGQQGIGDFALTNGVGSGSTSVLPGGAYTITAHYPGDGTFAASDSAPPISVTVNPEPSQTQVAITTFDPATGRITSTNATSVPFGSFYVLDINVSGKSGSTCAQNSRGEAGCATGEVNLTDNGTPLDGAPTGSGSFTLNPAGSAEDPIIQLLAGQHNLVATYSGDVSFTKGSSPTDLVTVTKASTATSIGGPTSAPFGNVVSYSISIDTQSNAQNILPTGMVTFFDGTTSIGSTPIIGIFNSGTGLAQAVGSFSAGSLQPGNSHVISAQYSGDANYASSSSNAEPLTIVFSTTTAVTVSPSVLVQHQNMTVTAQITGNPSGGPAITGTVQFQLGGVALGVAPVSNGQAQLTVSPGASGGGIGLIAFYSGDANYFNSSGIVIVQINPGPDFSMSANPPTIGIASPGATGTTTITITSQNGFTGAVSFACSGLPSESTCAAPSVNGSGTTTLTVMTTAPSMLVPRGDPDDIGSRPFERKLFPIVLSLGTLVLLMRLAGQRLRQPARRWIIASALLVFASVAVMGACGGGGGGGGGGPTNPGTPLGTTTIAVTATGTMNGAMTTHTLPITLIVQ